MPSQFAQVNKYGAPVTILLTQALIFSVLSTIFIFVDSINAAYWMLSDLSAQMALMGYIIMFAAAIKLRHSRPPDHPKGYIIPGGNIVLYLVSGIGIFCCITAMIVGFIPPSQIPIGNVVIFEAFLIGGLLLFVLVPWLLAKEHDD